MRLLARIFARTQAGGRHRQASRRNSPASLRDFPWRFPPSAVHDIEQTSDHRDPVRMTVAFLGLTGTQGVLPFCYTEWMLERKAAKDDTARRLSSISSTIASYRSFYRAWEKHRPPVLYELERRARPAAGRVHPTPSST